MPRQQREIMEIIKPSDEEIKDFERGLEEYKRISLNQPLEFYGIPIKNQEKYPGIVINSHLGGVHWGIVKYCLNKGIIRRRKDGGFAWLIASKDYKEGRNEYTQILVLDCPYKEFAPKWKALRDLEQKRSWAKKQEAESLENLELD